MAKQTVKEFYGDELYEKLLKKAEKNKFNGFDLKVVNKKDLMVMVADLEDSYKMAIEEYTNGVSDVETDGHEREELICEIESLNIDVEELRKWQAGGSIPFTTPSIIETVDSPNTTIQYNDNSGVDGLNDKKGLYTTSDW